MHCEIMATATGSTECRSVSVLLNSFSAFMRDTSIHSVEPTSAKYGIVSLTVWHSSGLEAVKKRILMALQTSLPP